MDFKAYKEKIIKMYAKMNRDSAYIISEPSDDDLIMMYLSCMAFEELIIEQYKREN